MLHIENFPKTFQRMTHTSTLIIAGPPTEPNSESDSERELRRNCGTSREDDPALLMWSYTRASSSAWLHASERPHCKNIVRSQGRYSERTFRLFRLPRVARTCRLREMHLEQPMTARGGHNAGDVDCDYYIYHSSLLRDVAEFLSCRTRTWTCAIVIYVWYDTVASRGKGVNHLSRYEYRPSVVSRYVCAIFPKRSTAWGRTRWLVNIRRDLRSYLFAEIKQKKGKKKKKKKQVLRQCFPM